MQEQLVCRGCRTTLMYPRGATNVCCALCRTISPPQGMDMARIVCCGCGIMLMYTRSATSVRCSCCHTLNLVPAPSNQTARINCGHCRIILMYPYGASSVKCAVCQYVTNVNMSNGRAPLSMNRPNLTASPSTRVPSTSTTQTVVVENPMSLNESGKLVSNVVVGVTTHKK
ncbi:protein LSD1 [Raphanus sativus]|uniref:Protein LSD1 n=1 Tax=Raphanus sativus TaxID=3726 RepID=A0A6J0N902_RAPSA|nr:protein LSD1 [Raphanus sativus]